MSAPNNPHQDTTTEDRGFNMRSLLYAAIPLGFVALVLFMVLGGEAVENSPEEGAVQNFVEGEQADVSQ